jgi:hypothetical protein
MEFTGMMWYWLIGLGVGFLAVELYAAKATPTKADTFSEFIWWVFGVKPHVVRVKEDGCGDPSCYDCENRYRTDIKPIEYPGPRFRRFILAGMCVSLSFHFVLATSVMPVVIFGIPVGIIMLKAIVWERK